MLALPGGPDRILEVLEDQLQRRRAGEPPLPKPSAGWWVTVDGFDQSREAARRPFSPSPMVESAASECLSCRSRRRALRRSPPGSTTVKVQPSICGPARLEPAGGSSCGECRVCRRALDLRTGVLAQEVEQDGRQLSSVGFSALHDPGTAALWVAGDPTLLGPHDNANRDTIITTSQNGAMAMHVSDVLRRNGDATVLERIAVVHRGGDMSAARSRAEAGGHLASTRCIAPTARPGQRDGVTPTSSSPATRCCSATCGSRCFS